MMRDFTQSCHSGATWTWSDGEYITFFDWDPSFIPPRQAEMCIKITPGGWLGDSCSKRHEFICSTNQLKMDGLYGFLSIRKLIGSTLSRLFPLPRVNLGCTGGWSPWSEWTACGVTRMRKRLRRCNSPEPFCGGSLCSGASEETRICCHDPGVYILSTSMI